MIVKWASFAIIRGQKELGIQHLLGEKSATFATILRIQSYQIETPLCDIHVLVTCPCPEIMSPLENVAYQSW